MNNFIFRKIEGWNDKIKKPVFRHFRSVIPTFNIGVPYFRKNAPHTQKVKNASNSFFIFLDEI